MMANTVRGKKHPKLPVNTEVTRFLTSMTQHCTNDDSSGKDGVVLDENSSLSSSSSSHTDRIRSMLDHKRAEIMDNGECRIYQMNTCNGNVTRSSDTSWRSSDSSDGVSCSERFCYANCWADGNPGAVGIASNLPEFLLDGRGSNYINHELPHQSSSVHNADEREEYNSGLLQQQNMQQSDIGRSAATLRQRKTQVRHVHASDDDQSIHMSSMHENGLSQYLVHRDSASLQERACCDFPVHLQESHEHKCQLSPLHDDSSNSQHCESLCEQQQHLIHHQQLECDQSLADCGYEVQLHSNSVISSHCEPIKSCVTSNLSSNYAGVMQESALAICQGISHPGKKVGCAHLHSGIKRSIHLPLTQTSPFHWQGSFVASSDSVSINQIISTIPFLQKPIVKNTNVTSCVAAARNGTRLQPHHSVLLADGASVFCETPVQVMDTLMAHSGDFSTDAQFCSAPAHITGSADVIQDSWSQNAVLLLPHSSTSDASDIKNASYRASHVKHPSTGSLMFGKAYGYSSKKHSSLSYNRHCGEFDISSQKFPLPGIISCQQQYSLDNVTKRTKPNFISSTHLEHSMQSTLQLRSASAVNVVSTSVGTGVSRRTPPVPPKRSESTRLSRKGSIQSNSSATSSLSMEPHELPPISVYGYEGIMDMNDLPPPSPELLLGLPSPVIATTTVDIPFTISLNADRQLKIPPAPPKRSKDTQLSLSH